MIMATILALVRGCSTLFFAHVILEIVADVEGRLILSFVGDDPTLSLLLGQVIKVVGIVRGRNWHGRVRRIPRCHGQDLRGLNRIVAARMTHKWCYLTTGK